MDNTEFKQRFESVDSVVYQELSKQIDERIVATPIYSNP